jgi:hypothetical protein
MGSGAAGEGLAHAEVIAYATFAEACADLVEIIDRHGEALIAVFAAAWPDSRRCAGFCGPGKGARVSESLSAPNVAEVQP